MLKKFFKMALGLVVSVAMFAGVGCTFLAQMDKESLADYVAAAVAEKDADALWEVASPSLQEKLLDAADNNEKDAKEALLGLAQLYAVIQGIDYDDLADNDDLQEKFAQKMLADDDFFVEIDGMWYIK